MVNTDQKTKYPFFVQTPEINLVQLKKLTPTGEIQTFAISRFLMLTLNTIYFFVP